MPIPQRRRRISQCLFQAALLALAGFAQLLSPFTVAAQPAPPGGEITCAPPPLEFDDGELGVPDLAPITDAEAYEIFMRTMAQIPVEAQRAFLGKTGLVGVQVDQGLAAIAELQAALNSQLGEGFAGGGSAAVIESSMANLPALLGAPGARLLLGYTANDVKLAIRHESLEAAATSPESAAGSTCGEMGWYTPDEYEDCNSACGQTCVKKQWCGNGPCEPWPNYCWKCPGTTGGGGGGGNPSGKTCAEMGWYFTYEFDQCILDCDGTCVKKQWCGNGYCQPWPHYCWKCNVEAGPPPPETLSIYEDLAEANGILHAVATAESTVAASDLEAEIEVFSEGDVLLQQVSQRNLGQVTTYLRFEGGGQLNLLRSSRGLWSFLRKVVTKVKKIVNQVASVVKAIKKVYQEGRHATCFDNPVYQAAGNQCVYRRNCQGQGKCSSTESLSRPPTSGTTCAPLLRRQIDEKSINLFLISLWHRCSNEQITFPATCACD